jgi:hypothetical protein
MAAYAIRATHGRELHGQPDFHEQLYDTLRGAPWWLASMAGHGVAFLLLAALVGDGSSARAEVEGVGITMEQPRVVLEEPIVPYVETIPPTDVPNEIKPQDATLDPVEVEQPVTEPDDKEQPPGDPRFQGDVDFEGAGTNDKIGVGGGGGGLPAYSHRGPLLHPKLPGKIPDSTDAGLDWLVRHQSAGGFWDCDGFESMCKKNKCGGPGGPLFDPGVSGLAMLAFLGYGETHKTPRYGFVVRNGLKYLKGIQDAEGCFGPRTSNHFTYNHAIAALAMAEAYGLTQSPLFKASAQNGINFVLQCQNPYLAWRYGVRPQDNDTSVTGWMVMALKSARGAGLDIDPAAFDGAKAWLDKVTEPEYGRAGYTARGNGPARPQELMDKFPADKSESLTAVAVLARIFCGAKQGDEMVAKGAELCARSLPTWDEAAGTIDYYYWYYGTLAMFQVGGDKWKRWNDALTTSVVAHQRMDPTDDRRGSWDPLDPWSAEGGRVYSTALNVLNLEVTYRYKVFGTK